MTLACIVAEVLALLGYLAGAVLYPLRLLHPEVDLTRWGRRGLLFGAALHGLGLAAHAVRSGEALLSSHANSTFVLILLILGGWWLSQRRTERPAVGAFAAPVVFLLALLGVFRPDAAPNTTLSPWVIGHVALTLMAYAAFGVAFCMAMAYLVGDWQLKRKKMESLGLLPPLQVADRIAHTAVAVGLPLLTLGLGVGVAAQIAGSLPVDAKTVMSVVIWLVYAGYLYVHTINERRGRRLQWALIVGFALVLVNFLLARHPVAAHGI